MKTLKQINKGCKIVFIIPNSNYAKKCGDYNTLCPQCQTLLEQMLGVISKIKIKFKKHHKLIETDETLTALKRNERHWAIQHCEKDLLKELRGEDE